MLDFMHDVVENDDISDGERQQINCWMNSLKEQIDHFEATGEVLVRYTSEAALLARCLRSVDHGKYCSYTLDIAEESFRVITKPKRSKNVSICELQLRWADSGCVYWLDLQKVVPAQMYDFIAAYIAKVINSNASYEIGKS